MEDSEKRLKKYILDPYLPELTDPKPKYFPHHRNSYEKLFHIPPCPTDTQIVAERDQQTGKIVRFIEVDIDNAGSNAKNSFSMQRAPIEQSQATRGSASNFMFWPGGFDLPKEDILELIVDNKDFEENLLSVAPGFSSGIDFSHLKKSNEEKKEEVAEIDMLSVLQNRDEDIFKVKGKAKEIKEENEQKAIVELSAEIDESLLAIKGTDVLKIKDTKLQPKLAEWAEIIDIR